MRFFNVHIGLILACFVVLSVSTLWGQIVETEKLVAGDAVSDAEFGNAVAIDGNFAIIGAHYDYNSAGTSAGAAYIFALGSTGNWSEIAKVRGSDTQAYDGFGFSVDISGERAIVGVPLKSTAATFAGTAYIFERDSTGSWIQAAKIMASDAEAEDRFGWSVAISGDYALIGAIYEDTGHTNAGSVYIFKRDAAGNWNEMAKIQPGDNSAVQQFGFSVAVDGEYAVIGANKAGHSGASFAGAAYIFKRDTAGNWLEVEQIVASDAEANDHFGWSVSISGGNVIVGAPYESSGGAEAGAAYIFERDAAGNWPEVSKIVASDAEPIDWFGEAVAIEGNRAVVGVGNEDTGGSNTGAAYIFEKNAAGNWSEVAKIQASDHQPGEYFGKSVGISGTFIFIGAPKEGDGWTLERGAVYVFTGAPLNIADGSVPASFELAQNYPNPFNPATRIVFTLPQTAFTTLKVLDVNGRLIKTLVTGMRAAGIHQVVWDGTNQNGAVVASGMYFYLLEADGLRQTRKMLLFR